MAAACEAPPPGEEPETPEPEPACLLPDASWAEPLPPNDTWQDCATAGGPELACDWMDVELHHEACGAEEVGIKLRLFRPDEPVDPAPLMLYIPGTGACYTSSTSPESMTLMAQAADRGVMGAALSLRGHRDCYAEGEPLHRASTWIGPAEMADYDRLLWAFIQGWVRDDLPAADPARLGMTGASHGGLTAFLYGFHTAIPDATGHPLALLMPGGATPSVGEWFTPGLDPDGDAVDSLGAPRLSGFPGQLRYYGGDYLDGLVAAIASEDGVADALGELAFRTAADGDGSFETFLAHVDRGIVSMSSQDCLIPKNGAFDFYSRIREAGAADRFRLVSPVGYHSCKSPDPDGMALPPEAGDGGYYPRWTEAADAAVSAWKKDLKLRWMEAVLLDEGSVDDMPDWLYMLADETDEPGELPVTYEALPPGELAVETLRLYVQQDGVLAEGEPTGSGTWSLSHDPGSCTEVDFEDPCVPPVAGLGVLLLRSAPLTEELVVVGRPSVTLLAEEVGERPWSITAVLAEVPDPTGAPTAIWPVTSERRYDATPLGAAEEVTIQLETVAHRFEPGHSILLVLTTASVPVIDYLMFAPSPTPFELELRGGDDGAWSRLELPVMTAAPVAASSGWQ